MTAAKATSGPGEIVRAIHTARVGQGVSIKALARKTGWSEQTILNMERGGGVKFRVVTDCAQALDVVIMALPGDAWGRDGA